MQRTDFDFDVISGPSAPSLASLLRREAPQPPAPPPAERQLDPAEARPETRRP